jgi:hypothetical protein
VPSIFRLDSGADTTTIVAERFGLRFSSLERGSFALTPAGLIETRVARDAILIFLTENGKPHVEVLETVDVISLPQSPYHGMLGMDILGRFNWERNQYFWRLKK